MPRRWSSSPGGAVIRNAMHLASDVRGLELALNATVGDVYRVTVHEGPGALTIGLRTLPRRGG